MFDFISDLIGGAGDWLSQLVGGVGDAAGWAGSKAADLGGAAWQGLQNDPWGAVGSGLQTGGSLYGALQQHNASQMPQGGFDMTGMQSQMLQPAGPSESQVRRRLADSQAAGMSGASPDFLATLSGVTPDELTKLMGYQYGGS